MDENTSVQGLGDVSQSDTTMSQSSSLPLLIGTSPIEVTASSSLITETEFVESQHISGIAWGCVVGVVAGREQGAHIWVIEPEAE